MRKEKNQARCYLCGCGLSDRKQPPTLYVGEYVWWMPRGVFFTGRREAVAAKVTKLKVYQPRSYRRRGMRFLWRGKRAEQVDWSYELKRMADPFGARYVRVDLNIALGVSLRDIRPFLCATCRKVRSNRWHQARRSA